MATSTIVTRGNTYIFNISTRLRLFDTIELQTKRGPFLGKICNWIESDPLVLWNAIGAGKVSLIREAYKLLQARMAILYPELVLSNEVKRQDRRLKHGRRRLKKLDSTDEK